MYSENVIFQNKIVCQITTQYFSQNPCLDDSLSFIVEIQWFAPPFYLKSDTLCLFWSSPSILSADFARLGDEVRAIDAAGADYIHIGRHGRAFVPNITVLALRWLRLCARTAPRFSMFIWWFLRLICFWKILLMQGLILLPCIPKRGAHFTPTFAKRSRLWGKGRGSLNPSTPLSAIVHVMDLVDLVLIMTVNPGFGRTILYSAFWTKVRDARTMIDATGGILISRLTEALIRRLRVMWLRPEPMFWLPEITCLKWGQGHYATAIRSLRGRGLMQALAQNLFSSLARSRQQAGSAAWETPFIIGYYLRELSRSVGIRLSDPWAGKWAWALDGAWGDACSWCEFADGSKILGSRTVRWRDGMFTGLVGCAICVRRVVIVQKNWHGTWSEDGLTVFDRWDAELWRADLMGNAWLMWLSFWFLLWQCRWRFPAKIFSSLHRQTPFIPFFPLLPLFFGAARGLIIRAVFSGQDAWILAVLKVF